LGILEILLLAVVALIVIPPDHLPEVMRAVGKILRELRLASNTLVRELSGAIEDPPYMSEQVRNNPMTAPWSKGDSDPRTGDQPAPAEAPPQR
jgi:Sec-independent protein translocase protein TatA